MSRTCGKFGLPVVVAVNHFTSDTDAEIRRGQATRWPRMGVEAISLHALGRWRRGRGRRWRARWWSGSTAARQRTSRCIRRSMTLADKIRTIAHEDLPRRGHRAAGRGGATSSTSFEDAGFGNVPVCIAKTQYSFSVRSRRVMGAPDGHMLPVREVRLSAGAGFVVAICGDIMTMPGLPKVPAADAIDVKEARWIGLF